MSTSDWFAFADADALPNADGSADCDETDCDDELLVSVRMAFIHLVFIPVLGILNFRPDEPLSQSTSAREP